MIVIIHVLCTFRTNKFIRLIYTNINKGSTYLVEDGLIQKILCLILTQRPPTEGNVYPPPNTLFQVTTEANQCFHKAVDTNVIQKI